MKRKPIQYSEEELMFVKNNCTLMIVDLHAAFVDKFGRTDVTKDNINGLRKRKGWRTGRTGRFDKGHVPSPKARPKGPNKTSFKKGVKPHNVKPLYSERIDGDGYVLIKVPERCPHTGFDTRYRLKHQWLWQQHHGQVPDGHKIHFIDGNKRNCTIENLEVLPSAVLMIMSHQQYSSKPDEVKPVIKTLAKIKHRRTVLLHKGNR